MIKEKIIYIEFELFDSFIFSCQKSWFKDEIDIEIKQLELAIQYNVLPKYIKTKEVVLEIPIRFPSNYMKNLVGDLQISYESED